MGFPMAHCFLNRRILVGISLQSGMLEVLCFSFGGEKAAEIWEPFEKGDWLAINRSVGDACAGVHP
jgi:hypothetical protein